MDCISLLPIKPYAQPKTEIFFPMVCNVFFAKLMGIQDILPINLIGSQGDISNKEQFIGLVHKLGISSFLWADSENLNDVQKFISFLESRKLLVIKKEAVLRCKCGMTEIHELGAEHIWGKPRTLGKKDSYFCLLCREDLHSTESDELFLDLTNVTVPPRVTVYPASYQNSFLAHQQMLKGVKLRISRLRSKNPKVTVSGKEFYLDVDLVWPLFIESLRKNYRLNVKYVISTHKTIKQLSWLSFILGILGIDDIDFIIIPTVSFIRERAGSDLRILELIQIFSPETVRIFLLTGLQWRGKESKIKSGLLYRTDLSLKNANLSQMELENSYSPIRLDRLSSIDSNKIRKIISKINREVSLDNEEEFVLRCLL